MIPIIDFCLQKNHNNMYTGRTITIWIFLTLFALLHVENKEQSVSGPGAAVLPSLTASCQPANAGQSPGRLDWWKSVLIAPLCQPPCISGPELLSISFHLYLFGSATSWKKITVVVYQLNLKKNVCEINDKISGYTPLIKRSDRRHYWIT